jgi:hypothetical protein
VDLPPFVTTLQVVDYVNVEVVDYLNADPFC